MKTINRIFSILLISSILLVSCSKSDSSVEDSNDDPIGSSDNLIADFQGSMIADQFENEIVGNITVSEAGIFSLLSFSGRIIGDAELTDNSYTLTNLVGDGSFEGSAFSDGELNINDLTLTIEGNLIDSSPLIINGPITMTIEEFNQAWRDARTKSSVFFSHSERCYASITLNGTTFENLGPHYHEGALCDEEIYGLFNSDDYHRDVDNAQSIQIGGSEIVVDPGTGEISIRDIYSFNWFIVQKNTEYSYEVRWGNGDHSEGTFTSADGGGSVAICPTSAEVDCDIGGYAGCNDYMDDEIFEDNVVVDYASSNTDELGGFVFANYTSMAPLQNGFTIGGNLEDEGSHITFYLNNFAEEIIEEGIYPIVGHFEDGPSILAQLKPDGHSYGWTAFGGSVEVLSVDYCTTGGGEIDLVFWSVKIGTGSFPYKTIKFSGPVRLQWESW